MIIDGERQSMMMMMMMTKGKVCMYLEFAYLLVDADK